MKIKTGPGQLFVRLKKWYTPLVTKIKQVWYEIIRWDYAGLSLLILIIFALHLATIMHPASPVFDEQYYVPAANSILHGQGTDRIEHPPLAQLTIAAGIFLLGDNPFGWRFFSILFGIAGLILFYLICLRLGLSKRYAFLATFLLAFENLSFIQSSLAMLDVYSLTFMLASFWFYLKATAKPLLGFGGTGKTENRPLTLTFFRKGRVDGSRYVASGILAGLAALAKLTGALVLPIIILHWLLTNRKDLKRLLALMIAAVAVFFLMMPLLEFVIWHKWLNPLTQIRFMLKANALATFGASPSEMLSRPWEWLLKPEILTYWIEPHHLAMISPPVWAMTIPVIAFTFYRAYKNDPAARFAAIWFVGAYLIWIPASLVSDRISYIYYFYPSVGAVCIALTLVAEKIETSSQKVTRNKKWLESVVPAYILLCLGAFVILSPISYWWKAPLSVMAYVFSRYYLSAASPIREG